VTGGICPHPPAEAVVMRRLLLDLGASDDQIVVEDTARSTLQSAIRCSAMLCARADVGAVVVCSSRYHVRRCRMLMRLNGIRPDAAVASQDAHRVGPARYAWSWARDFAALPFDATLMSGHWLGRRLLLLLLGRP
jgi:uncharacterized SAM-binding protein YcdF (DUF218 family)